MDSEAEQMIPGGGIDPALITALGVCDVKLLRGVAGNPNTPSEVLAVLAKEKRASVRQAVAFNSGASPELLAVLATDRSKGVREYVASNQSAPAELLAVLATDQSWDVRLA